MKKILVVCAALMLPCLLVHAQEAEGTDDGVVFNIIPRLDLNPVLSTEKGGENDFNLGNTSLYTLFEGNITENLSFSIANHWLSREPKDLYKDTFLHTDTVNWLDWANLTYTFGDWSITAGKQPITTGGFELDDYDWEVHPELNSSLWETLPVYQWGGKIGWNASETTSFSAQMTTSPFGRRPLKSGLFNYSGEWRGTYDNFETITSLTFVQTVKLGEGTKFFDCFQKVLTVGLRYNAEPVVLTLDLFNKVGTDDIMASGYTILPSANWTVNDDVQILFKVGIERTKDQIPGFKRNSVNAGVAAHWTPLKDKALRLHASFGYNSRYELATFSVGALYNLSLKVK